MKLINATDKEFADISSEEYREYDFGDGTKIKLAAPLFLNVNDKSGGHRVLTTDGVSHYIPSGWKHLSWKAKQGKPHFVK
jgi:hypothetical protein